MGSVGEADLRTQEARLLTAMRENNLASLASLFDREYVFTSGSGAVWGREQALLDFADPAFSLRELKVDLEHLFPLADAGVVIGRSHVAGKAGGASVSGVYRFTRVWRRTGDVWTILTTHTSLATTPA